MRKPTLAGYATLLYVSGESINLKPDVSKKTLWGLPCEVCSLLRKSYVDTDIPPYEGQYVGGNFYLG